MTPGVAGAGDFQRRASLFDVSGKVIVVTGASSGIGRRMVTLLHDTGAEVIAAARRKDRLQALAREHPGVIPFVCDVTKDDDCEGLIEHAVDLYGRVDVLINNAGFGRNQRAEEETPEQFREVVGVNLVAPFVLTHFAAIKMLDQPTGGAIINIVSIFGIVGLGRIPQTSYAASKAGLVNLTRELSAQWARKGIRVNAIAPGWFPSEMTDPLISTEEGRAWIERMTPMGRAGRDGELDGAVLFLASDASSYVTGCILPVDGGWTAV
jgi:NAD(P)-dependent dehydrogenase (short-subunit alcohol dehydrogenase family)